MGILNTIRQLFQSHTDLPEYYQKYLIQNHKPTIFDIPIAETRFVILDTETTGLSVKDDKILSIAAMEVINNQVIIGTAIELYVQYDDTLDHSSATIHGITKNAKVQRKPIEECLKELLEFCGNSVIVGHHIGFDIGMINRYLSTVYGIKMKNLIIDTANLYIKAEQIEYEYNYYPKSHDLSLDAILNKYRIETIDRHTAHGDAYTTALLFLKLVSVIKSRNNTKLKDLLPF
jgi:DNA polymerase III subunit epsilon